MSAQTAKPIADTTQLENAETLPELSKPRVVGRPFTKGNPGRKQGPNKPKSEASAWALPLVPEVLRRRLKHRRACEAAKDCAMCRHYNDMVLHYAYGKPPQRHEMVMATLKADTAALAKSMGLDETQTKQALDEVERHYEALKAAKP